MAIGNGARILMVKDAADHTALSVEVNKQVALMSTLLNQAFPGLNVNIQVHIPEIGAYVGIPGANDEIPHPPGTT